MKEKLICAIIAILFLSPVFYLVDVEHTPYTAVESGSHGSDYVVIKTKENGSFVYVVDGDIWIDADSYEEYGNYSIPFVRDGFDLTRALISLESKQREEEVAEKKRLLIEELKKHE